MSNKFLIRLMVLSVLAVAVGTSCEDSHDSMSEDVVNPPQQTSPSDEVVNQQQQNYDASNTGRVKLSFAYGGFRGENAVEDPAVKISNLKIRARSGMSYSWASGSSLKVWGLADTQADALACVFYQDSKGNWIGGKFDWISTSRTTRDFKNLNDGYNGWKPELFYGAAKHGFCIVSKDGKKRSNFITD